MYQLKQNKEDKYLVSFRKSSNLLRVCLVFLNMMSRQANSRMIERKRYATLPVLLQAAFSAALHILEPMLLPAQRILFGDVPSGS